MRIMLLLSGIALLQLAGGCGNQSNGIASQNPNESVIDTHNSQSSLDWEGSYHAVMPCADCEGIATNIILERDNTYRLSQRYLGKDGAEQITTGDFMWIDGGNKIKLDAGKDGHILQVGENQLFWLDNKGNRITGDLEEYYRLVKQDNDPRFPRNKN